MTPKIYPPVLCPGGTVVCLATGPSLNQADCDYVRGKAVVIAINDSHRLAPWADCLYSSDRKWYAHYNGVPGFKGLKFGIGSAPGKRNPFPRFPDIQVLTNVGYDGFPNVRHGLTNGRNSGFAAIVLSVHLGARRVILLGYNMNTHGGKSHWFGRHPSPLPNPDSLLPSFRKRFYTLIKPLADAGVTVINCTEHSSLDMFPFQPLREVLPAAVESAA